VVSKDVHESLFANPGQEVTVNLKSQTLRFGDRAVEFPVDSFSKHCLLEGVDELGFILKQSDAIAAYEARVPGAVNTLGS